MDYRFISETIHDIPVHREFIHAFQCGSFRSKSMLIFLSLMHLWYMTLFSNTQIIVIYLIYFIIFWGLFFYNAKHGDINYRRSIISNGNKPPHLKYYFGDEGILAVNMDHESKMTYSYSQFIALIETSNLLILEFPERLCLIIQKAGITEGTPDALKEFLFEKCTGIKKKKVKNLTFGKWLHRIHLATMLLGILVLLLDFPGFSIWDRVSGRLHNDMTYQQMAAELKPLGIYINDLTIEEMEAYDAENAPGQDYYDLYPNESKIQDLLYWEGYGYYDEETSKWYPSDSGIYWFDVQFLNADTIYEDLFAGIRSLNKALKFTDITTDYTLVDSEAGISTVSISFCYQGETYQLEADYDNDWLDLNVLMTILEITGNDSLEENLYYAYDGIGCYLYYGTKAQARDLQRKTGLHFDNTFSGFDY